MAAAIIPALLTIGGAAVSASQARAQNKGIQKTMESQARAAALQQRQLATQTGLEQKKEINRAEQIVGRLRVAAGEAGVGYGGSYAGLERQAAFDAQRNLNALDTNYANNIRSLQSGAQANMTQLANQATNPLLAAFSGGMQGIQTGLSIAGGLSNLQGPSALDSYMANFKPNAGVQANLDTFYGQ